MKQLLLLSAGLALLTMAWAPPASAQTPRYVKPGGTGPAPYTNWATAAGTIQDAIDASSANDTIWVSNGTYEAGTTSYGGIDHRVAITNAITVRSANNDPANTTIKGAAAVRGVYMVNGSSLIGFTITNCTAVAANGGGVNCQSTSATISNCVIVGNSISAGYGGGVCYGSLYYCTITNNNANGSGNGAGAVLANLYYCTLANNTCAGGAGGGSLWGSAWNCTYSGNYGGSAGGGACYPDAIYNCTFTGNTGGGGGGVHGNGSANVYNSKFRGNTAGGGGGGGVYLCAGVYNCEFIGNQTDNGGGARNSTLYNCTLVGNSGNTWGGGTGGGTLNCTLYNCISWSNNIVDSSVTPYYSCGSGYSGNGNIDADPMFLTNGTGYGPSHVAGNYRLTTNSPCFNTGTNLSWMTNGSAQSVDLDGNVRISFKRVDMGAYETIHDIYVSRTGNNISPYFTWANAATNIQDAVNFAGTGNKVVLTNDTYTLTNQISIAEGITLEGLNGSSNTFINGNYPTTTNRCFYLNNAAAIISGLTISNGYAGGSDAGGTNGGGVYVDAGLVRNCVISSNMAVYRGGGVYLAAGTITNSSIVLNSANLGAGAACYGNTTMRNCTVSSNNSPNSAGGVDVIYLGPGPTTIENCTISYNSAMNSSGGLQCQHSCTVRNCVITGNRLSALHHTGAGMRFDGGTFYIEDCLIANNNASGGGVYGGGGFWTGGGVNGIFLRNCTIVSNKTDATGGGIFANYGNVYAVNTIIYSNVPQNYVISGGITMTFTNCCTTPAAPNGTGNITAYPGFVDPVNNNYRLANLSPCINKGIYETWMVGAVDLDGKPRVLNGIVDIGAYETLVKQGVLFSFH